MWALVEDNAIVKIINNPKAMVIGDVRHSKNIFSSRWTNEEREAIGLYEVVFDDTNKKDEAYYINTDQSFAFAGGKVTASYGSATAKPHADILFTAQDEVDGKGTEGEVKTEGLKTIKIRQVKSQAASILQNTDWYVTRKADDGTAIPSAISTKAPFVSTSLTYPFTIEPIEFKEKYLEKLSDLSCLIPKEIRSFSASILRIATSSS